MSDPKSNCPACNAGRSGIFAGLSAEQARQMLKAKIERSYRKGQVLFYTGDDLHYIWCIHSGQVKLSKISRTEQEIVIRFLGPGDLVGYRPILAGEPSAAVAECIVESEICLIPRETFLQAVRESQAVATAIIRRLAQELRTSEERWLEHASDPVDVRVARFLGQLIGQAGAEHKKATPLKILVPRKEIADAAGTTPSTLSRVLAGFAKRGRVELGQRHIEIVDVDYFKNI